MAKHNFWLDEEEMPRAWYNIQADLPRPMDPMLHPGTGKPIGPDDLAPLFPDALIAQEVSTERWIEIPQEVSDIYRLWRPTPLQRASRLEKFLGTPARIYYKNESVSPPGSHKPNTAVAQVYYNKREGVKRITTETGAGQWGSALSFACKLFGVEATVYMVRISYEQKPYRRVLMHVWDAEVIASPSDRTNAGRMLRENKDNLPGSLGMAISEAVEDAATHDGVKYSLGSVLSHVLMHQTIIGQEAKKQLQAAGEYPDVVIGCVGGGSNYSGLAFPFIKDMLSKDKPNLKCVAVEPTACPTLTRGPFAYDYGDTAKQTPLIKMHTLGHDFVPAPIHSGGLRYHGDAPLLSFLKEEGFVQARSYPQTPVFEAALMWTATEGIVPAPETSHAIRAVVDEALECKKNNEDKVILFNFSGHGHFDLAAYEAYLNNDLVDYAYPEEQIEKTLANLPKVDG